MRTRSLYTEGFVIEYVKVASVLKGGYEGREVKLRGWVYRRRLHKDKAFILLRDCSGIIQLVAEANSGPYLNASRAGIESAIEVSGIVVRDERAPGGFEVHLRDLQIIGPSDRFPITRDASYEYLLDVRHLWIRSRKLTSVFKVRHEIFRAIRDFFEQRGFYEVQGPMFITAAVEGGATLFPVKYLGERTVYLTQSSQFYLEALIYSLEKVYTIAPSFRAEKSRTRRHLTEFWHAEAEVAWAHLEDILKIEEELICYVIEKVIENRSEELRTLGRNLNALENVKPPFYRLSYDEAIYILRERGFKIEWGEDFGADEERELTKEYEKPVFIYGFPEKCKAFYHKNDPRRPEVTLSADLLAPEGYGEIMGGGERISDVSELVEKIRRFNLNPSDYEWYIDLRRYGSVPHAGFGLGVDRLVMWICGLNNIVDSIPFPRTIRRVYP